MKDRAAPRVLLPLLLLALPCVAQNRDYNRMAKIDGQGNIFVSSDEGRLVWMAGPGHCSEAIVATDRQTVGCMVAPVTGVFPPGPNLKLEIYLKDAKRQTIEPGAPILEWNFWKDGKEVAIHSGSNVQQGTYALYESATGRLINKLVEPQDERTLPQWAKSRAQIQDEAVPMSAELRLERIYWVAKVLRQIGKIQPGMRRKDLSGIFTTEGGASTRFQRIYVYADCPYIKVTVRFRATSDETNGLKEDPDDSIESISQPFLQWGITD